MDCKTAQSLLERYLDNELDRSDARELEAHADGCADCAAALSRLGELRRSLRDQSLHYAAPASLRERIAATARGEAAAQHDARRTLPAWPRLAAAALLAFAAGGGSVYLWNTAHVDATGQAQLARDLFASHWRALAAASPVDVVSSDRHTVKPWFAGKVAAAPLVQDFADQGFALAGGRIDYVGGERVAVLVYRHGQHLVDVFVLPPPSTPQATVWQGYTLDAIALGGQPAAIVTDMDRTELGTFERLLGGVENR